MPIVSGNPFELSYRVVVLGDYAVGKSSIALQYVKNQFNEHEESTIGAAFLSKVTQSAGHDIRYEIWDTAGQERYNSLIPMYYRGAQVAIVVYDITSYKSFERAKAWIKELNIEKPPDFLKVLVGNKLDLERGREVPLEKAREYAQQLNLIFYETSAKDGTNIDTIFSEIAGILPRQLLREKESVVKFGQGGGFFDCC